MSPKKMALGLFGAAYGRSPTVLAWAPSRVNLIGGHTDYNQGFVLPMALPFKTVVAVGEAPGRQVRLTSKGFSESSFSLDESPSNCSGWARYVSGMAHFLIKEGLEIPAFDAAVATTVPIGAGLGSSAALEMAAGRAIGVMAEAKLGGLFLAQVGQRVENEVIGISSGIMDQLVSATAIEGAALAIDCRSLEVEPCAIPKSVCVVIMDTMTRRELEGSSYEDRRSECESACRYLGVESLSDVSLDRLLASELPSVEYRRAKHVVTENARTQKAVDALRQGNVVEVGEHMNSSHKSLRHDFQVSSDALNAMVEAAHRAPGCLGARMTGGGFGGCAVALVSSAEVERFTGYVTGAYRSSTGNESRTWVVSATAGAGVQHL